jgi:hypothetical protein
VSWNAKWGMNPGDEARSEPLTRLPLRLRRNTKQKEKRMKAAESIPSGMPTPSPIFWVLVRPSLLAAGASGSEVEDDARPEVEDGAGAEAEGDSIADVGDGVVDDGVGREEASDEILCEIEALVPDVSAELSVVDAVVSTLADVGDDVSHAVSGPNSRIR